jgi:hypothetical protein
MAIAIGADSVGIGLKHKTSTIDKKGGFDAAYFVCKFLVLQIAGEGFEPPTFGL